MFHRKRTTRISIIILILLSFTPVSLLSKSVEASLIGSQMLLQNGTPHVNRENNEKKIREILESKIVVERLKSYGLNEDEITAKLHNMSDEQVHQLAALSDRITAGGNGAAAAAVIVLVVFVIAIILLIVLKRI